MLAEDVTRCHGNRFVGISAQSTHDRIYVPNFRNVADSNCEGGIPFRLAESRHQFPRVGLHIDYTTEVCHNFGECFVRSFSEQTTRESRVALQALGEEWLLP